MKKIIAGLLVLVFVVGFAVQVVGHAALDTVFSPEPYVKAVRQPIFVDAVAQVVRDRLAAQVADSESLGGWVSQEDVDWIAERVVTGPWLSDQLGRWMQAVFDWLKSDAPQPTLVLSLAELKSDIPSLVETLLVEKVKRLPLCGTEALEQVVDALLQGGEMPLCIPPGLDAEALVKSDLVDVPGLAAAVLQPLPDEIDVMELLEGQGADQKEGLLAGLTALRNARFRAVWGLNLLALFLVVLLLVIGLLRSRPRRALLQWWGASFFLSGGLTLLLVGSLHLAREYLWQFITLSADGGLPTYVLAAARPLFTELLSGVWGQVLPIGGAAALAGTVLGLISLALPRGESTP